MASGRIFCCSVFDLRKNSKFSRISTDLSAEKCYKWIVKEPRIGKVSPGPRKVSQKALFCNGISFSRGASRRAGKKVNNVVNILSRRLSGPSGSKCECFLGFSGLQSLGSLLCCVSKAILCLKGTCSSNGESGEVEENQNKCRRLEARKELQALELIETLDIPLVTSIICTRTFSWSSRTESGCTTSVTLQPKKMNLRVTSSKKFLLNLAIRLLRSESCEPPTYPCGKSRCNSYRQPLTVPDRSEAIHRGTDQELGLGPGASELGQLGDEIGQHRLDAKSHRRGPRGTREKVRHAGHHADVGLRPDGLERGGEERSTAALDDLGTRHQRSIATIVRAHVTLDIRVTDDGHAPQQRHRDQEADQEFSNECSFAKKLFLFHACLSLSRFLSMLNVRGLEGVGSRTLDIKLGIALRQISFGLKSREEAQLRKIHMKGK